MHCFSMQMPETSRGNELCCERQQTYIVDCLMQPTSENVFTYKVQHHPLTTKCSTDGIHNKCCEVSGEALGSTSGYSQVIPPRLGADAMPRLAKTIFQMAIPKCDSGWPLPLRSAGTHVNTSILNEELV